MTPVRIRLLFGLATGWLALSLGLAWVSSGFQGVNGWLSYAALLAALAGVAWGTWRALAIELLPARLGWLLAIAAILRLAAGAFFFSALPVFGYNSPPEQAGYVMADAYERDQTAWELARSEKPLLRVFGGGYRKADQYGGMLFLSAGVYRFLGGSDHQPLLMASVAAVVSSLAVLFLWAFARRAWGEAAAWLAAGGLAVYPEAVLLGGSQMREAFTITLAAAAFYGLLRYLQDGRLTGLIWMGAGLAACLPFSPPIAGLLLAAVLIVGLVAGRGVLRQRLAGSRWLPLVIVLLVGLVALGMWAAWRELAPAGGGSLAEVIRFWVKKSAEFQAHLSERASGWVQKIFDSTPTWSHLPLLLGYGVLQPFLPAAIGDVTGAAIWRAIAVWRSLGWSLLLPFLIYAPLRAFFAPKEAFIPASNRRWAQGLSLAVWLVVLVASFRSGGDAWDNPRYRAAFAALQLALAAWAWMEQRRLADPWLPRILVGGGFVLAWFLPWYLRRYIYLDWPVEDLFKTIGLGAACGVLYALGDWFTKQSSGGR